MVSQMDGWKDGLIVCLRVFVVSQMDGWSD